MNTAEMCTYHEGVLVYCLDDSFEEKLAGEGVTMIHNRLILCPIPAVNFQTAAAFHKGTNKG